MAIHIKGTRFVYYPVPKCACTSLKLAILRHNDRAAPIPEDSDPGVHGVRGYWSKPFDREWRRFIPFARPFCIVRDPIDRFVSAYRNRVVYYRDLGEVPGINDFALSLESYRTNKHIWHHFMPMVEFIGRDPSFFDRVFTMNEIKEIPDDLGVPLAIPREQMGGPRMSRDDLSKEALACLFKFYADDYRAWGNRLANAVELNLASRVEVSNA